jgi:hypothetical protein
VTEVRYSVLVVPVIYPKRTHLTIGYVQLPAVAEVFQNLVNTQQEYSVFYIASGVPGE